MLKSQILQKLRSLTLFTTRFGRGANDYEQNFKKILQILPSDRTNSEHNIEEVGRGGGANASNEIVGRLQTKGERSEINASYKYK